MEAKKRDTLRLAIAHFLMGCKVDTKSSKNKANKMGKSNKKELFSRVDIV